MDIDTMTGLDLRIWRRRPRSDRPDGLTQREVAEMAGVSHITVCRWETEHQDEMLAGVLRQNNWRVLREVIQQDGVSA